MSSKTLRFIPLSVPFFAARPSYLGEKRKLCPLISALVAEQIPRSNWSELTRFDSFLGRWAISLDADALRLNIVESDLLGRAMPATHLLVGNSVVTLTHASLPWLLRTSDIRQIRPTLDGAPHDFIAAAIGHRNKYRLIDELYGGDAGPPDGMAPTLNESLDPGANAPPLMLSEGGPTQPLDELEAVVSKHRSVTRVLAVPSLHLRSIASG